MTYLLSLKWHFWEAVADAALAVWAESCGRASGDPSDALLNLKCLELLLFFFFFNFCFVHCSKIIFTTLWVLPAFINLSIIKFPNPPVSW